MQEFSSLIKYYKNVFRIPEDIEIEIKKGKESEVFFHPIEKYAIISVFNEDEIAEYFAELKLGLEYDPILTTIFLSKNASEEEKSLASKFIYTTYPVKTFWTWRIMKKYLSDEEFKDQIEKNIELIQMAQLQKMIVGKELLNLHVVMGTYLIVKNFADTKIQIKIEGENKEELERYKSIIEEYSQKTPSIHTLIELSKKLGFEGDIQIEDEEGLKVLRIMKFN